METVVNSTKAVNETKSASDLLKDFLASVNAGNAKDAAAFFAEDGYLEAPYVASFGMPSKFEGPEAIAASMTGMLQMAPDFHFTSMKVIMENDTQVVAEYESEATLTNGKHYKMLYIGIITSRDGKIVSHREFLNTVPFVEAFFPDGLQSLITNK